MPNTVAKPRRMGTIAAAAKLRLAHQASWSEGMSDALRSGELHSSS